MIFVVLSVFKFQRHIPRIRESSYIYIYMFLDGYYMFVICTKKKNMIWATKINWLAPAWHDKRMKVFLVIAMYA